MSHRPSHPARHRRSAFTLLELSVGLVMVAIIGLSLVTAMSVAFRARTTAREQTGVVREAMIGMDVIQQELGSALPPRTESLLAGPFVGYAGGTAELPASSVSFYVLGRDMDAEPDDPLAEGPRWVQLALVSDGEKTNLVRQVQRNLLSTILEEPAEEILLTAVRGFGVRYYDGIDWLDEWDSTEMGDSLPVALEITLELEATSPQDPLLPYRLVQVIPLPCARPDLIEQAMTGEAS